MHTLNLDYETYSECDIGKAGTYAYAAHPSTEILMAAYSIDGGPVSLWQPHLEPTPPPSLVAALLARPVVKRAFNAAFERLITKHCLNLDVPIEQWQCSQAASLSMGFPAHLDGVLAATGLRSKDPRGKQLIQRFSVPNPASYTVRRYTWETHPEEWQEFCEYCVRDVEVEKVLWQWIEQFEPNIRWSDWHLDQHINEYGIPFDLGMAKGAVTLTALEKERLAVNLYRMTGVDRPTRMYLMPWFASKGVYLANSTKDTLASGALRDLPEETKAPMKAWSEYQSRAGDKFKAALLSHVDGRLRGVFQFMGAARTGRWAGRIIQPHNLKQTIVGARTLLETQRRIERLSEAVTDSDIDRLHEQFPEFTVSELLGSAVRHAIKAPEGKTFAVCDWSSIESRILGWLTHCRPIIETFANGLDTYKVFASKYYEVPYENVSKQQRNFAKPPTLGCGYRLGTHGLVAYAEGYGVSLSLEESARAVDTFRTMYPEVPYFWTWIEQSIMQVIIRGGTVNDYRLKIWKDKTFLYIRLPSGRKLCYHKPEMREHETPWGEMKWTISYMGVDQKTTQWSRQFSHGGKFTENVVQAIAADVLMEGLRGIGAQLNIFLHVHDEIGVIVAENEGDKALLFMQNMMAQSPRWAPDLSLAAEGWVGSRYAKL